MHEEKCSTCRCWERAEDEPSLGRCLYEPPPIMQVLADALTADPSTMIDYGSVFSEAIVTSIYDGCDAHQPKPAEPGAF